MVTLVGGGGGLGEGSTPLCFHSKDALGGGGYMNPPPRACTFGCMHLCFGAQGCIRRCQHLCSFALYIHQAGAEQRYGARADCPVSTPVLQGSHAMNRVPRGENMVLCLQVALVHGGAVGTATPKQPKINLVHI